MVRKKAGETSVGIRRLRSDEDGEQGEGYGGRDSDGAGDGGTKPSS